MTKYEFRDKTVVVTGGSMGIGAEFAAQLARRGAKLVLVARDRAKLERVAAQVGGAEVIAMDLGEAGAAARLFAEVTARGLDVDVLVNNAGFGAHGAFASLPLELQRAEIDLNVGALVELSHVFLPMIERRRGGILHVASTAAFQPVPYMAVYAATKAFVLSFSEALWGEYRSRGVRIVALCPGATDTPFFERAGEAAAFGAKAVPADVVRLGLDAFDANRPTVVHGAANVVTAMLPRFFSRGITARVSELLMRPKAPKAALSAG